MIILKLDIDGRLNKKELIKDVTRILRLLKKPHASICLYRTKKGYHVYAEIAGKMPDFCIVALQLFLGSDRNRELFNIERIYRNEKEWNVLFCLKKIDGKEVSKETFIEMINVSV